MTLQIKKAERRALPLQIAFYGPSSSGKTMSALMFAAGLVNGGKVAVIDTERGRASLYADNKKVLSVLPNGFDVVELDQPYHPKRFIEALNLIENSGYKACLIDSMSDAWDGPGGCTDMAEENKGRWNKAKLWSKRLTTRIALSDMHVIECLKAQEKSKIVKVMKNDKESEETVPLGILPIAEKNWMFPLLLAFSVDPQTHLSTAVKCHDDLWPLFPEPRLISKEDGARIRLWNESGKAVEPFEQIKKRAKAAAEQGTEAYMEFFNQLSKVQKRALIDCGDHSDNKTVGEMADAEAKNRQEEETGEKSEDGLKVA